MEKKKMEQLKHREERNKLLKLREEENEQLKRGEEENEQLKHGEEEKKQLQHGKENTKQIALENMCERVGKSVQCKLCSRVFAAITYFNRHYYRLHAPKTIKCPKCPKLFGSARMLNEHTYNYHIEAICTECGKAFNNRSISKHKQSHHINFPCKKCKHVYKTQNAYNRHLRFQRCGQKQNKTQADAIFTCDICDKNFCHKTSLNRHIGFMHGNGNVCKWCNKKYSTQSRLNAHIVKHTQCKNLSCTVCNGKFIKNDLNIHTKPYKCVNCDARFICSTQRSMHAQRYPYHRLVPDLQFECHICCRKFYQKYSLERHNKEVKCHNNKKVSTLARIRKNIARQCYYKTNIIF
ncbi:zinc finger protein 888-like [Maniola hyperantus]|uniref:zinc finger protein 888-like n=1 Tax=Aphantopus hyperantus TaxID=2795564 RepID=UPI0037497826